MKFLCLAYEEEQKLNDLSHDEWLSLREETLNYVDSLSESGRLIMTYALQSARTASMVRVRDDETLVTDGPFAETKEQIGGFFLIEANTFDEALQIAERWPSARIGGIEVRPIEEELQTDRRYR